METIQANQKQKRQIDNSVFERPISQLSAKETADLHVNGVMELNGNKEKNIKATEELFFNYGTEISDLSKSINDLFFKLVYLLTKEGELETMPSEDVQFNIKQAIDFFAVLKPYNRTDADKNEKICFNVDLIHEELISWHSDVAVIGQSLNDIFYRVLTLCSRNDIDMLPCEADISNIKKAIDFFASITQHEKDIKSVIKHDLGDNSSAHPHAATDLG